MVVIDPRLWLLLLHYAVCACWVPGFTADHDQPRTTLDRFNQISQQCFFGSLPFSKRKMCRFSNKMKTLWPEWCMGRIAVSAGMWAVAARRTSGVTQNFDSVKRKKSHVLTFSGSPKGQTPIKSCLSNRLEDSTGGKNTVMPFPIPD